MKLQELMTGMVTPAAERDIHMRQKVVGCIYIFMEEQAEQQTYLNIPKLRTINQI